MDVSSTKFLLAVCAFLLHLPHAPAAGEFPPIRVRQESQQMVANGLAERLICSVPNANPAPHITWEFESGNGSLPVVKQGEYLYKAPEYGGHEMENVVTFTPTEGMDGTLAKCIASHPTWNETKSQTYQLKVFYPPRIVMDEPVTITVSEGESFCETVKIVAKPPTSVHRWHKNGAAFEWAIGTIETFGPEISGKAVTPRDSGLYKLTVANRVGNANVSIRLRVKSSAWITNVTSPVTAVAGEDVVGGRRAGTVSVKYTAMVKPKVSGSLTLTKPFAEVGVVANASFTLRCDATRYPPSAIQWAVDGQPIGDVSPDEEPYTVAYDGTSLSVKNFSLERAVFECRAESDAGTAKETFVVATLD